MSGIVELCGNVHPSYRAPGTKWVPVCERKADHPGYHAKGILYWQDGPTWTPVVRLSASSADPLPMRPDGGKVA